MTQTITTLGAGDSVFRSDVSLISLLPLDGHQQRKDGIRWKGGQEKNRHPVLRYLSTCLRSCHTRDRGPTFIIYKIVISHAIPHPESHP